MVRATAGKTVSTYRLTVPALLVGFRASPGLGFCFCRASTSSLALDEKLNVEGSGDQAGSAAKDVLQRSDSFRVGRNELRKIEVDRAVDRGARFLELCDALTRESPIDSESRHCPGRALRDPELHARQSAHAVPQKREEARRP